MLTVAFVRQLRVHVQAVSVPIKITLLDKVSPTHLSHHGKASFFVNALTNYLNVYLTWRLRVIVLSNIV